MASIQEELALDDGASNVDVHKSRSKFHQLWYKTSFAVEILVQTAAPQKLSVGSLRGAWDGEVKRVWGTMSVCVAKN